MKCASAMRVRQRLKQWNIQWCTLTQVVLIAMLLFNCLSFFSHTTMQVHFITEKVKQFERKIKSMSNSMSNIKSTFEDARDEFKSSLRSLKVESLLRLKSIETEVVGINEKLAELVNLTKRLDDVP